jgi:putative serine protease PepD
MTDDSSPAHFVLASGHQITITGPLSIGRSVENAIKLDGDAVSRKHATLDVANGKFILQDLGSSNGTYINDKRISGSVELRDGDRLRIGPNVLTFKKGRVSASSTMVWQTNEPLTLVRGDGSEFGVNRSLRIGRGEDNELPLNADNSASQYHAKIDLVGGQAFITDLSSRNGTWVNGKRITGATRLKHGDKVLVGDTIFRLKAGSRALAEPGPKPAHAAMGLGLLVGGGLLSIIVVGILLGGLATVFGLWYFMSNPAPAPTSAAVQTSSEATPAATLNADGNPEQIALRALVFVVSPMGGPTSTNASTGSGSLVDGRGYVLTNFHVIGDPRTGQLYNRENWVLIGLNWANPVATPDTFYQAEVVQSDPQLDLALLRIFGLEDGDTLPADLSFPYLPVGDSDDVQFGDSIAVIGFPGLGGDTPTLTRGTVSGFLVDERNNLDPGWFKTDAEINPGNSGGMAINSQGELIGVPTQAFTGTDVTGKISEIRPINFARPFLDEIR